MALLDQSMVRTGGQGSPNLPALRVVRDLVPDLEDSSTDLIHQHATASLAFILFFDDICDGKSELSGIFTLS
ncbi:hypothetical protein KIN20_021301 [Parelaphostrongylus tenuis]|uniref:Uncharacterized protein n=1 Tax=Parelaphostrongylus tenuis TaxID=148309 RepID=A0AAD5QW31_PARTN|nr:hypothetical protein KIN20_021301 [Parelaphostrongylus tenuis]